MRRLLYLLGISDEKYFPINGVACFSVWAGTGEGVIIEVLVAIYQKAVFVFSLKWKIMKQLLGLLLIAIVTSALAQPRGESWESANGSGDDAIGFLAILGVIAIFVGFKESQKQGWINLSIVGGIVLLNIVFPAIGGALLGVIGLVFAWIMIKEMWSTFH